MSQYQDDSSEHKCAPVGSFAEDRERLIGDLGQLSNQTEAPTGVRPTTFPYYSVMFHGVVGRLVSRVLPYTEADAVALLIQFLAFAGALIGRSAHFSVGGSRHFLNIFVVLVARSSKGRKGTSLGIVRAIFRYLDKRFLKDNQASGLSSGEGLIHRVRDEGTVPSARGGREFDPGVRDKRLVVSESEFGSTLKVASRDGNTLSNVLRCAWDGEPLETLTKNSAEKATDPHIVIVAHISEAELAAQLNATEQANGFANRFIWLWVGRSKLLPNGGNVPDTEVAEEILALRAAIAFAPSIGEMRRDADADKLWAEVYPYLSGDRFGLYGAITARAEAQTMRLACLYAVLDRSAVVREEHLLAALALWLYSEECVREVFTDSLGNPVADSIWRSLRHRPDGMTRTEINQLFSRNRSKREIETALELLKTTGRAQCIKQGTGSGRPVETWLPGDHSER